MGPGLMCSTCATDVELGALFYQHAGFFAQLVFADNLRAGAGVEQSAGWQAESADVLGRDGDGAFSRHRHVRGWRCCRVTVHGLLEPVLELRRALGWSGSSSGNGSLSRAHFDDAARRCLRFRERGERQLPAWVLGRPARRSPPLFVPRCCCGGGGMGFISGFCGALERGNLIHWIGLGCLASSCRRERRGGSGVLCALRRLVQACRQ